MWAITYLKTTKRAMIRNRFSLSEKRLGTKIGKRTWTSPKNFDENWMTKQQSLIWHQNNHTKSILQLVDFNKIVNFYFFKVVKYLHGHRHITRSANQKRRKFSYPFQIPFQNRQRDSPLPYACLFFFFLSWSSLHEHIKQKILQSPGAIYITRTFEKGKK